MKKFYSDKQGNKVELVGSYEDIDVNGYYKVFVLKFPNGNKVGVADIPFRRDYRAI